MPNLDMHSRCNYFVCINLESFQKCIYYTIHFGKILSLYYQSNYFHCVYTNIILIDTICDNNVTVYDNVYLVYHQQ